MGHLITLLKWKWGTNRGFSYKNGRVFNISNIRLMRYKTVKLATLIPTLNFFAQQVSPPNTHSGPQGLNECLSLAKLLAVDNVCRHRKSAMCLVVCRIKIVN